MILVLFVYLESAKIYTGPKIVRILKGLGNTVVTSPVATGALVGLAPIESTSSPKLKYETL